MPIRFPKLCAAALLMICTAMPFAPHVLAKGKKGKSSATRVRGKSSPRSVAKNFHRSGYSYSGASSSETDYAVVPDEIEVQEYGSSNPSQLARWLSPSREVTPAKPAEPVLTTPTKRQNVKIDSSRVIQIQQALANRGFYTGELTGVYDEATIDSMRRFQLANRIPVTGYPTAQALKRLGLTSW